MLKRKKVLSFLLAATTIISVNSLINTSVNAYAADISNYEEINDYKFYEGKDSNGATWKYKKNNDGSITLYGTRDLTETMIVPDRVDGYKVTGLKKLGIFEIKGDLRNENNRVYCPVRKIILPDTLEYLKGNPFEFCVWVDEINFPSSLKYFDYSCLLNGCLSPKGIDNLKDSQGLIIINNVLYHAYNESNKVIIPSSVTEIAEGAFCEDYLEYDRKDLTEVMIPGSVKKIGAGAFKECKKLSKVTMFEGVQEIDASAFESCDSLDKVQMPNSIKKIGAYAFKNCTSLKELDIPRNIENLGTNAFDTGTVLRHRANSNIDGLVITDDGILYSAENAKGDIVIPNNVRKIRACAFINNKNITSVHIPEGATEIGESAFEGCSNLSKVNISDSVKVIENKAFSGTNIKKIKISKNIEKFGEDVFLNCSSLEDASNRDNGLIITKDGVLACGITAKDNVTIPSDVKEIQHIAFFNNSKIKSITIPGSVEKINSKAFQGCKSLSNIILQEGIRDIGDAAFLQCSKLEGVILPDSLEKLGEQAFGSCSNLQSVSYKDGLNVQYSFQNTPWNDTKINGGKKVTTNEPTQTPVGRQYKNGKWYYYNMDRTSPKGWFFDVPYKSWYYVNDDGSLKNGWFYDNNYSSWFYLDENGVMKTGWFYDNNYNSWFYLNGNGTMRTGWFYDNSDGNWYYLYSNGMMAHDAWINGYYVNSNGAWR